ncbi:ABC transporter permease [Spelaeicoccus albus]|uniref:Osmoprotectant transport system permease protein n=1 Tax=Spelaeicoccus albus TaxID=1280376 RepID=A0A7Z0ABC2_9MICO|nr:ABC transporter permease subunit [Spelaeicoccus albus]NYI67068.1 osmoprotectant transport system permease protein [Spelaeicoccus albus]
MDVLTFMSSHFSLLVSKTGEHLELSIAASIISIVIGVPIGVWLGHMHRGEFIAVTVSNIGRALPSLALIAVFIGVVGLGFKNVLIALVILAVPPILTNAYLSVEQVVPDIVRAGKGMGLTGRQVLFKVELPLALPLLFAGVRTAVVLVVGSATLGAVAGGGGLGDIILRQAAYGLSGVIAGAIWVAALAILADVLLWGVQKLITPRGLRSQQVTAIV